MRVRVRAVIVREDGSVLLIHRLKGGTEYWVFPGGGMEDSDATSEDALRRECREELGVEVRIIGLFASLRSTVQGSDTPELFYSCEIVSGELGTGTGPEYQPDNSAKGSYSLEWMPVVELGNRDVRPEEIKRRVTEGR